MKNLFATSLLVLAITASGCASGGALPEAGAGGGSGDGMQQDARQILVVLPPGPEQRWLEVTGNLSRLHNLQRVAAWEMESLGEFCVVYRVPSYTTPQAMAERLARDQRVRSAQPNQRFRVRGTARPAARSTVRNGPPGGGSGEPADSGAPGDPYWDLQHAARTLRLTEAHRLATGRGVTVALVDTGVDVDHPDLRGRVAGAGDFVNQGEQTFTRDIHGTAVAGVVAAAAGNRTGILGVAPDARLLALKACWHEPPDSRTAVCTSYTLAQALDSTIGSEARVLTLSLTGPDDPLLARLLRRAIEAGILVVAAVDTDSPDGGFPAHQDGVLAPWPAPPEEGAAAPASADLADAGPDDALRAPAVEILTTTPGGSYDFFSGTSFAAAHAAGVAALVLQVRPDATPADVTALLRRTARITSSSATLHLLDADAALRAAAEAGPRPSPAILQGRGPG